MSPRIKIVSRWGSSQVLYECDAETLREAVIAAVSSMANLSMANLSGADLSGADLSRANLSRANLSGAGLSMANLSRANLSGANLSGADLSMANLSMANLSRANLSPIKDDLFKVLDSAPHEVLGLLAALRAGLVDGSTYSGRCACLVGTLAQTRGSALHAFQTNSGRPAERWFLAIRPGNTPINHEVSRVTEAWVLEWIKAHPEASPRDFWRLRLRGGVVADGLITLDAARAAKSRLGAGRISHVKLKAPAST